MSRERRKYCWLLTMVGFGLIGLGLRDYHSDVFLLSAICLTFGFPFHFLLDSLDSSFSD